MEEKRKYERMLIFERRQIGVKRLIALRKRMIEVIGAEKSPERASHLKKNVVE